MLPNEQFTPEQQQYLSGFVAGADAVRASQGLSTFAGAMRLPIVDQAAGSATAGLSSSASEVVTIGGPDSIAWRAQDRFVAAGKKLCPEEQAKRATPPLDLWEKICKTAAEGKFPKGTDVLLWKYQGLFYVAPAQNSFMCRLRFPAGIVQGYQLRGLADIAERLAGGYADVTTRANFQLREIGPQNPAQLIMDLVDLGILCRGSGADNIRNITGTSTAGIDRQELIDVRPLCREMNHYILQHRDMYALPRKFNIAFDGGGSISALHETNDIGFAAVKVTPEKATNTIPAGIYFRVLLGGITGHCDIARETGLMLKPEQCVPVAAAMVRVFIEHGDRTDRKKARLKYLLEAWGFEKFVAETQKLLPFEMARFPEANCEPRGPLARLAHIGVHPQRQAGRCYLGVVLPVGRLTAAQLRGLAKICDRYGSGHIRLTVWQNLLIPDIAMDDLDTVRREIRELGLDDGASNLRAGLVACTGNAGCKYANANTKKHAMELVQYLEPRVTVEQPINIHFTGCPHSCAQHYIGDIGLLGTKVEVGEDMVEGYHLFVGGGYGERAEIGRELFRAVPATDLPQRIEVLLRAYLEHRVTPAECFQDFVRRHPTERLLALCENPLIEVPGTP